MVKNFDLKNQIIDYFKIHYPYAANAEMEFYMTNGIVESVQKLTLVMKKDKVKRSVATNHFYDQYGDQMVILIENNDIVSELDIDKDIKGEINVDIDKGRISFSFYEVHTQEQYMGEFVI